MSPLKLKKEQLAYAAGIIDGEGCIRIARAAGRPVLRSHVTNTNPRLSLLLKEWFGGYVWTESKAYMPNAKIRYVWEVSGSSAGAMLTAVAPYLVLKRDQCELALAIQATMNRHRRTTPEVKAQREVWASQLRVLTKRGAA